MASSSEEDTDGVSESMSSDSDDEELDINLKSLRFQGENGEPLKKAQTRRGPVARVAGSKKEESVKEAAIKDVPKQTCNYCCKKIIAGVKIHKCKGCVSLALTAVYCSLKCIKDDARRHKGECETLKEDKEVYREVLQYRKAVKVAGEIEEGDSDSKSEDYMEYQVGGSITNRVTVRRQRHKSQPKKDKDGDVLDMKERGKDARSYFEAEWEGRFKEGCTTPCKPWVNFGTPTSVVVSWLPPTNEGTRYSNLEYNLQMQIIKRGDVWEPCPHEGNAPSHIVNGLSPGDWVRFRVGVRYGNGKRCTDNQTNSNNIQGTKVKDESETNCFSEPSDPFQVGYADFSPVNNVGIHPHKFSEQEMMFFSQLNTPARIQDYLDTIPMNHEVQDDTCLSALESVRQNQAHCIEGAMLGAYLLSLHGFPPLLMDLRASTADDDHIVTPFYIHKRWGCLSVSNHASLRYRNPVYKSWRELIMSYFDDYMNGKGQRTLRSYSKPVNLDIVFGPNWHSFRGDSYAIAEFMDHVPHYKLLDKEHIKGLRPADNMVLSTTVAQREWQAPDNFDEEQLIRNENK
eukprot:m.115339 g.115339  ORF g.115339 m.115339 type:complete len:570 (-) comp14198_c0_seq2:167-1876(-)